MQLHPGHANQKRLLKKVKSVRVSTGISMVKEIPNTSQRARDIKHLKLGTFFLHLSLSHCLDRVLRRDKTTYNRQLHVCFFKKEKT